ncbi:MAG TPA: hypothetical protein VEY33_14130 [Gemmatimonadota bacterium]|nr:hypothetical protein [Gemmatimonadota bacterium]
MSGESKTEAVRQRRAEIERFLEREVWARIPKEQLGRALDKEEVYLRLTESLSVDYLSMLYF